MMWITAIVLLLASCKKDNQVIPLSGTITLSSKLYGSGPYYAKGFNFAQGTTVNFVSQSSPVDLLVTPIETLAGDVVGGIFESPQGLDAINLTNYFSDSNAAQSFFDAYLEVNVTSFTSMSDSLRVGDIYTFRTSDNKYAKILVKAITLGNDGTQKYVDVQMQYKYQPSGSTTF